MKSNRIKNERLWINCTAQKVRLLGGSQIRSYVMQPYTMVKDHRTDEQIGNVQSVLDGEIDALVQAYLKKACK